MRLYRIFLTLVLLLIHGTLQAQFTLTIEVKDLRSNAGQLLLQFFDENHNNLKGVIASIEDNKSIIEIKDLKPGKYAFRYFHDENSNDEFDVNWMGIPKEGFGFSNNATGVFRSPAFDKWLFELRENIQMICNPRYL